MSRFQLTEIEKQSALWIRLREYLTERRDAFRIQNDNNLDEARTQNLRGHIQELNHILDLENPE